MFFHGSGPMRGLKKLHLMAQTDIKTDRQTDRQTHGHGNSLTELAHWGLFSENQSLSQTIGIWANLARASPYNEGNC